MNSYSEDNGGTGSSRLLSDHGDGITEENQSIRNAQVDSKSNLETAVKFLLPLRRPGLSRVAHWLRPKPARMAPSIAGPDTRSADFPRLGLPNGDLTRGGRT